MDTDPCTTNTWWSAIGAAAGDSTLAGVLAGLLIAAAAALLVGWYEGSDPHTIALFGSGVPALSFSTYLFTVIAGMKFPQETQNGKPNPGFHPEMFPQVCHQLWSQWLLAMGLLFIGGAVLVCGLGWALVSYAENLAVKLCQKNISIKAVEDGRRYFIILNGWLSGGVIGTTITLLISTNVLYLKSIDQAYLADHAKWYAIFFVFTLGILFISRSWYVAFNRTRSAERANMRSCAAYVGRRLLEATDNQRTNGSSAVSLAGSSASARHSRTRGKKQTAPAAQETAVVLWVALCAVVAFYMTNIAFGNNHSGAAPSHLRITLVMVVLYIIARAAYAVIVELIKRLTARKNETYTDQEALARANAESVERIRITYSFGGLSVTTRCVVLFAILAAIFDVVLTQGPVWEAQSFISLFLGGLFPAAILTGLGCSVPAAEDAESVQEHDDGAPVGIDRAA